MLFFDELDELEEQAKTEGDEDTKTDVAPPVSAKPEEEDDEETDAPALTVVEHTSPSGFSLQETRSAQASLIREYAKANFQERLHALDTDAGSATALSELAYDPQLKVAKKSGYEGSKDGVAMMMAAMLTYTSGDPESAHRDEIIRWLLSPKLQKTQPFPKGPARCTIYSTARIYSSDQSHICAVQVHINDTIRCLKENIYLHTRKPWLAQKLFVKETELFDQVLLSSLMRVGATTDFRLEYREQEVIDWLVKLKKGGVPAIDQAPETLLADPDFMRPAVQLRAKILDSPACTLREDRDFVLQLAPFCGQALRYASPEFTKDREIVLAALRQDPWVLELAAPDLRADREIVWEAVKRDSWALQFASPELRKDEELVMLATRKDPSIILQVLPELQKERKVVLGAIQQDWRLLESLGPVVQSDKEFVLAAVRQSGWALQFVPQELLADRDIALEAMRNNGDCLRFVAPELLTDREVLYTAVKQSGTALGLASPSMQDLEMAIAAVKQDKRALVFVARRIKPQVLRHFGLDWMPEWARHRDERPDGLPGEEEPAPEEGGELEQYYTVLELPSTASKADIRRKYHQLALQYHPDKFAGDAEVGKRVFQRVQEAYEALANALGL